MYVNYAERNSVVDTLDVTAPRFGKKFQFNGGFSFDPAKLFLTPSGWKATFGEIQGIDKATALLGASDALKKKKPWGTKWFAFLFPKVDFKILSQFDFIKDDGILVEPPFRERALNTWTFTWDLTRVIPDTKNRIDAVAAFEAVNDLNTTLGKDPNPTKRCILHFAGYDRNVDVQFGFSAKSCQELAKSYSPLTYELACVSKGPVVVGGGPAPPAVLAALPAGNACKW